MVCIPLPSPPQNLNLHYLTIYNELHLQNCIAAFENPKGLMQFLTDVHCFHTEGNNVAL